MDAESIISALLALSAAHTGGHFNAAGNEGVPASLHGMAEHYDNPVPATSIEHDLVTVPWTDANGGQHWGSVPQDRIINTTKQAPLAGKTGTEVNGGGFSMQDQVTKAADNPNYYAADALIKLAHLMGIPEQSSSDIKGGSGGDLKGIETTSGNKYTREIVGASTLADLAKVLWPNKNNVDVSFTTMDKGTPGLMISVPVDNNLIPVWTGEK